MKYSVRGILSTLDGSAVVSTINSYPLWRLITGQDGSSFIFEAWVNTLTDKTSLFDELKPFVDSLTGSIDWHQCTHDETVHTPCVIAESYEVS